jgi:ATP-dependent exoDNAse (exonuclease V) beta subunit
MQISHLITEGFPHFLVIKASAGTGKTYILSKRIVFYLLSTIKNNDLRNILAITFTVNASKEMKRNVIDWLKGIAISDQEVLNQLEIPKDNMDTFVEKADSLLETIFFFYKDFQIRTIDSFLTSVFKACATDFGYPEDFKIVLNNKEYLKIAFDAYLSSIDEGDRDFFEMLDLINKNEESFTFMPHNKIFDLVRRLYVKERHYIGGFINSRDDKKWDETREELYRIWRDISNLIEKVDIRINNKCSLINMLSDIEKSDFNNLFSRGDKTPPVLKADKNSPLANILENYWEKLLQKRKELFYLYSERYYYPYITVLKKFTELVETIKKAKEIIFIEDIPSLIMEKISKSLVPDVYMRMGGRLYHYFIDEFQDTSPIQYENLKLFIENSLSEGGSLFIVGDTKQAIYGFRDTDYEIMSSLASFNPFLSVSEYKVNSLCKNHRSGRYILDYAKNVFNKAKEGFYKKYFESGLFDWDVEVKDGMQDKGYVYAKIIESNAEEEEPKEKTYLINIINDLKERGFSYSDIAILAHKNSQIVEVSSWLSEFEIPFLSFSSLDIRNRKVIRELIYLLRFLENPTDNLSFASFLIGDIFNALKANLERDMSRFLFNNKEEVFLYKKFQKDYPDAWNNYFEGAFNNVGYLPVYELLCYIIRVFKINEHFMEESGAVAKLLEILKDLESEGKNSLQEFLEFVGNQKEDEYESNSLFELPIPKNADAVKLMTVHKAKGLGFPAVIYLIYPLKKRSESLKIEKSERGLRALKLSSRIKLGEFENVYENIKKKEMINDLNSFYVGLTRAMYELYVIGISYQNEKGEYKREFPVDMIIEEIRGNKGKGYSKSEKKAEDLNMIFNNNLMIHESVVGDIAFEEKRRGEVVHLILSRIDDITDLSRDDIRSRVMEAVKYCKNFYPEISEQSIAKEIVDFLTNQNIRPFFECKGSKVLMEKEYFDPDTSLIRIDRLILNDDMVQIIDFKTGGKDDIYNAQLKRYSRVIKNIYKDKDVQCYILYFDLKETENIS